STILEHLRKLKYHVTWKVVNSAEHGVPQNRSRIYIVGRLDKEIKFHKFKKSTKTLGDILEQGLKTLETDFTRKLFSHYTPDQLNGKAIKDKRGGKDNIHSWDIESKGPTSKEQRELLNLLLKQRRRKKWAERKGIDWMDGMPLTYKEIREFYNPNTLLNAGVDLKSILDDLVDKGYLRFEHPKKICEITGENGHSHKVREYALDKEKGYNIVVGKLSFEISKILDPKGYAPTLTATDVTRLAVVDGNGLRRLTIREGLRVSGFPESYTASIPYNKLFDLVGNTVMVPVIHQVAVKLLS
ncbi:MAG: DNA (cytosine-5-)-methyltransferase, partial [Desulfobacteraceae bacterium]|nr:DNA (cytosine-5-)-methyltransferase [Desulfobacteraceae bacterium]